MFDKKVVRRRRAALAVFVALSIAVLTAYFGESRRRPLPRAPARPQEAFAPVESGASRALKPVRDLFSWVGDTFDAKGETRSCAPRCERLRSELAEPQTAERDAAQLRRLVALSGATCSRRHPARSPRA